MAMWPDAEIDVDAALVRSLLAEQHPDLAHLPIRALSAGFDNTLWRVGDDLLARLPRRAVAAALAGHEQRWLPELAPRLPLPVPVPVRTGRPSGRYPWPWSIVPWLRGDPADRTPIEHPARAASQLGHFLRALHRPAPHDAPRNPFRGVALAQREAAFEQRLAALSGEVDVAALRGLWRHGLAAGAHCGPPMWIHGDLHPANVLVHEGVLSAVIDFGDLGAGDPATDLAAAWMLLPLDQLSTFRAAYGAIDAASQARALGWVVLLATMLLAIGLEGRPSYAEAARAALARAAAHPL